MNAPKLKTERCTTTSAVMLFADGELDPARSLEIESHLERCASCREELELAQAVRKSLRRSASRRTPEALETRLRLLVESELPRLPADRWGGEGAERSHAEQASSRQASGAQASRDPQQSPLRARMFKLATLAAAAAVGGLLLTRASRTEGDADLVSPLGARIAGLTQSKSAPAAEGVKPAALASAASAAMSFDALLDELVNLHADPLPPETTDPEQLVRLETFVGVPVKSSAMRMLDAGSEFGKPKFDGARIHAVREHQRAAAIQYSVRGHRLTMYVFDSRGVPMRVSRLERRELDPALVRARRTPSSPTAAPRGPVYVGTMRGYSVAATEHGGVGYALASDLDPEKNALMVASF
jgi:anti-sigma factor RsiW